MKIEWRDCDSYRSGSERHRFIATLFEYDPSYTNGAELPDTAIEFARWLTEFVAQVPEEWRAAVELQLFDSECDECSRHRASITLLLKREETDDELSVRLAREESKAKKEAEAKAVAKEKADRANYERLKAKYSRDDTDRRE